MRKIKTNLAQKILDIGLNLTVLSSLVANIIIPYPIKVQVSSPTLVGKESSSLKSNKVIKAMITAYTSTPDQTDDTPLVSASGRIVYDGMIAANCLAFGTKVKIPAVFGDKVFTVYDRMNKRYGCNHFDVWLPTSRAEAMKFGVKKVDVEVYSKDVELGIAE